MGKVYNNQIKAGSGFAISGPYPIDDRVIVDEYNDLAALTTANYIYEGMEVYVVSDKKSYKLIDGTWKATILAENIHDGQLVIQNNGEKVAVFTANQSGEITANIKVPTAFSQLDNDCQITSEDIVGIFKDIFKEDFKVETESTETTTELVDSE